MREQVRTFKREMEVIKSKVIQMVNVKGPIIEKDNFKGWVQNML